MIAELKGRSLAYKITWFVASVLMFIPMFVYELATSALGKRTYSKRQIAREFDHGYSPLRYGREESNPKHREVWNHALAKTYDEFASDLRSATLMGIIYRFHEPETTEEFDDVISDYIASLRRQPDPPSNIGVARLWDPAVIINFLDTYYKKEGFNFTHYYVNHERKTDEWRILKVGPTLFKPEHSSRSILYYEEYFPVTPPPHVQYSFSGDRTSIRYIRFEQSADADFAAKIVAAVCNFATSFVSAMFNDAGAATIISKLNASPPQPFEMNVQSAKIRLEWKISHPYWSEPDQIFASLTFEKI